MTGVLKYWTGSAWAEVEITAPVGPMGPTPLVSQPNEPSRTDVIWYDTDAVSTNPSISSTVVDAKGDLIVGTADNSVARLAVGATNGQVLAVDSAQLTGLTWTTPSSVPTSGNTRDVLIKKSSSNYDFGFVRTLGPQWSLTSGSFIAPAVAAGGTGTSGQTIDPTYVNFSLIFVPQSTFVDQIICEIKDTGTNRFAKMGLWADSNGFPANVVIDSGAFSTSTSGVKTIAISSTQLIAGMYWAGIFVSAATSIECANGGLALPLVATQYGVNTSREAPNTSSYPAGALINNPPSNSSQNKPPWVRLRIT